MPLPSPQPSQPAVITGASQGIGKAIAHELAALGYPVILVARRGDVLEQVAQEIRQKHGVPAHVRAVDLADREARQPLVTELADTDVSILVANAGVASFGLWHEQLDPAQERAQVELNTVASYDLTLAVLPKMLERGSGGVVITGSIAGNGPIPNNTTYSATKAFLNTFSEALHYDVKRKGIHVTLLAPGPVKTGTAENTGLEKDTFSLVWDTAEHTAKATVAGLRKNKLRVVPTPLHQLLSLFANFTPRFIYGPIMYRVYGNLG